MSNVELKVDDHGRATVTLGRPERHNAFDEAVIAELAAIFTQLAADARVRVVVLAAQGASFSAGADLGWMQRVAQYSEAENRRDALGLAQMLRAIDGCPKPVVALVQGAAYGGGVGLIAACDIAIAVDTASFALSEVRLGLVPAVISPYVVAAIGPRACRRLFLTGERFPAAEALRLGLVHEVVPASALAAALERTLAALAAGGPQAQAAAKELLRGVAHQLPGEELDRWTVERIAAARASPEGREGVAAFLAKRTPSWRGP